MRRIAYIHGLDRIRFFLALWVMLSHMPFPWPEGAPSQLRALSSNLFCGVAAVIAFFVVSGLCVHFPNRHSLRVNAGKSILRRSVRIGIPLAAILVANEALGALVVPIWSVCCEEIYYLLYPLLLRLRRNHGSWRHILLVSFVITAAMVLRHPEFKNYWEYGYSLTWLLGLPCWLLGCSLAERVDTLAEPPRPRHIWVWRGSAIAIGTCLSVARFHAGVGYPLSLTLFSVFVFFWLQREITAGKAGATRHLELAGKATYSLYLVHNVAFLALHGEPSTPLAWAGEVCFALLSSWLFYVLVERPAHRLSRKIRFVETAELSVTEKLA